MEDRALAIVRRCIARAQPEITWTPTIQPDSNTSSSTPASKAPAIRTQTIFRVNPQSKERGSVIKTTIFSLVEEKEARNSVMKQRQMEAGQENSLNMAQSPSLLTSPQKTNMAQSENTTSAVKCNPFNHYIFCKGLGYVTLHWAENQCPNMKKEPETSADNDAPSTLPKMAQGLLTTLCNAMENLHFRTTEPPAANQDRNTEQPQSACTSPSAVMAQQANTTAQRQNPGSTQTVMAQQDRILPQRQNTGTIHESTMAQQGRIHFEKPGTIMAQLQGISTNPDQNMAHPEQIKRERSEPKPGDTVSFKHPSTEAVTRGIIRNKLDKEIVGGVIRPKISPYPSQFVVNTTCAQSGEEYPLIMDEKDIRIVQLGSRQDTPANYRPDTNQGAEFAAKASIRSLREELVNSLMPRKLTSSPSEVEMTRLEEFFLEYLEHKKYYNDETGAQHYLLSPIIYDLLRKCLAYQDLRLFEIQYRILTQREMGHETHRVDWDDVKSTLRKLIDPRKAKLPTQKATARRRKHREGQETRSSICFYCKTPECLTNTTPSPRRNNTAGQKWNTRQTKQQWMQAQRQNQSPKKLVRQHQPRK